jgi:thiol-disulfide isomerase/thioredoxin
MMTARSRALFLGPLLAVILLGCSGGGNESSTKSNSELPVGITHTYTVPAGTADRIARGEDPKFFPAVLVVGLGDTLAVDNQDVVPHTVGPLGVRPNETYRFRFTKEGIFEGACTIHPSQQTRIIVAPSYVVTDVDSLDTGATTLAAHMDGRPTLITVWATWCEPCRRELPQLQEFAESHPEINVVTVNLGDDRSSVTSFLDDVGVSLTSLIDTEGRLTSAMKVASVPSLAMIDSKGAVVARHTGELGSGTLDELLDSL